MRDRVVKFRLNINENIDLFKKSVVILYLLGFRWASNSDLTEHSDMWVSNQSLIKYILLRLSNNNLILRYTTLDDHESISNIPEISFNDLFEILNDTFKGMPQTPIKAARLDTSKNPCITVSEDYDLVFKNNQIYAYSIDPEVEPDICRLLKNNEALWLTKLNDSVHSFQRRYSRRTDFKEAVIQRLVKHLKTNL